ncbi:MAG: hypothetical protein QMD21_00750 [Candidatus Thermoplasmatota archaeon]|nr:hypothetical protein [Candidatus Thermoplasmatota archaeon]
MKKRSIFQKAVDDWFKGKAIQEFIKARCRGRAFDAVQNLARRISEGAEEYRKRIMEGAVRYRRKVKTSASRAKGCDLCIGVEKLTNVARYELIGEPKAEYIPKYLCEFHYQHGIYKDNYCYRKIK